MWFAAEESFRSMFLCIAPTFQILLEEINESVHRQVDILLDSGSAEIALLYE